MGDTMKLPKSIIIRDVGPRDGLQAESNFIETETKIKLIQHLAQCGIRMVEATSFVSPKAIPQLRDAESVVKEIRKISGLVISALVGNIKGVQRAITAGVDEVQVVISASEEHNKRNVNKSIRESLLQLKDIISEAQKADIQVRAAIATAFGCPFQGKISVRQILWMVENFVEMGIKQVTLADTAGLGDPFLVEEVVTETKNKYPQVELALHFHDTRGLGLANSLAGLQSGVTIFETSLGGLGGCPFIPQATGNIATEDLVFMCERMGIHTGVNLDKIVEAAKWLERLLGRQLPGHIIKTYKACT